MVHQRLESSQLDHFVSEDLEGEPLDAIFNLQSEVKRCDDMIKDDFVLTPREQRCSNVIEENQYSLHQTVFNSEHCLACLFTRNLTKI